MPERSSGWRPNGLCSLFVCDIADFGHPARSDLDRAKVRMALYDGLCGSFDGEGIPFLSCYREDRGDGALLAVPPHVDVATLLTSLVDRLRADVRRHNYLSAARAQMRLRVAVHTGTVRSDPEGLVGTAVNHAFRILEAEQLRQALRRTGTDLVLIASERVYEDVIRHGDGLVDPDEYQPVEVRIKETIAPAWIRVPGTPVPTLIAPVTVVDVDPPTEPPTTPDPPRAVATIADQRRDLDSVVDLALAIRQLRGRHLRNQIVAELPLALTRAIRAVRVEGDRADMAAIVRTCHEHPQGLQDLLRVVRQFVGDSAHVERLSRSIAAVEQT
ncbi:MAG TPA: hypothetical protein VFU43_30195 [Streptosporangiaceae bacterium]|nr:hypothetical protein [Streptosporangiaceae bacterium]